MDNKWTKLSVESMPENIFKPNGAWEFYWATEGPMNTFRIDSIAGAEYVMREFSRSKRTNSVFYRKIGKTIPTVKEITSKFWFTYQRSLDAYSWEKFECYVPGRGFFYMWDDDVAIYKSIEWFADKESADFPPEPEI